MPEIKLGDLYDCMQEADLVFETISDAELDQLYDDDELRLNNYKDSTYNE